MAFGFNGSSTMYSHLVLCSLLASCLNSLVRATIMKLTVALTVAELTFTCSNQQ